MKNILTTIENMRDAVVKFGEQRDYTYDVIKHVSNDTDIIVNLIDTLYNDEFKRFEMFIDENESTQTESFTNYLNRFDDVEMCGFSENFAVVSDMIENGELK